MIDRYNICIILSYSGPYNICRTLYLSFPKCAPSSEINDDPLRFRLIFRNIGLISPISIRNNVLELDFRKLKKPLNLDRLKCQGLSSSSSILIETTCLNLSLSLWCVSEEEEEGISCKVAGTPKKFKKENVGFLNLVFSALKSMDIDTVLDDDDFDTLDCSIEEEFLQCEEVGILEPYEGMEFESEEAAKVFYDDYARNVGFIMRVMSCRRSEVDGRILSRRLGCNKEGHCVSIRGKFGPVRKQRASTREGCKAMVLVKVEKSGKWVVTRFVKEHNHPLVVSSRECRHTMDEKDKQIQELTAELRRKKRLCAVYREQLRTFIKDVEEHNEQLSTKVQLIVNNIREIESEDQELSFHR